MALTTPHFTDRFPHSGTRAQEHEVVVVALLTDLTFVMSVGEATHPVMMQSLEPGAADSLGLASEMATAWPVLLGQSGQCDLAIWRTRHPTETTGSIRASGAGSPPCLR
jgi:hypothetical protein